MPALVRPERRFSFADHVRNRPRDPLPGDRLDAQIENLIQAIHSTQQALADIRRDDGKLRNDSVGLEQLSAPMKIALINDIAKATSAAVIKAEQAGSRAKHAEDNTGLFARDAEAAAISAAEFLNAVNRARQEVDRSKDHVTALTNNVDAWTSDAENWATYAEAQASNAQAEEQMAAAWAEYLAGPVVDSTAAPAYIAGSPFGHGLYYQPVEGYGGNAGLWSAKWWAIYAAQLVGPWGFYYLGGWATPPFPGSTNPDTGIKVPNPLAPGSFYYDTSTGTLYVWDGSEWKSPYVLASGAVSQFVYQATAGQTVFSGADFNGATPNVGTSPSDVHLNGVRLVQAVDYTVDSTANTLTLDNIAVTAGSIVQWDLLVPPDDLIPGDIHAFKVALTPALPNGTTTNFTMTYNHPVHGTTPVNITDGAQLQVSLDGIVQEPGVDYAGSGNTLIMQSAPIAGAHFWAVWFSNAALTK